MKTISLKMKPIFSIVLLIMVIFVWQPSPVAGASVVRTDKDIYNQGEKIKVIYTNAPGNSSDWICIVPEGTPDTEGGDYLYTPKGLNEGVLIFDRRSPGKYEVRAYYNYSRIGYVVTGRYPFSVVKTAGGEAIMARKIDPNNSHEANLPSGQGLVYIFREKLAFSSSSEVQIKANEKPSVYITDASYFPFAVPAGNVKFTRGDVNTMVQIHPGYECEANVNVKPGYVYYLKLQVVHNPLLALTLEEVPHEEGANSVKVNRLTLLKR